MVVDEYTINILTFPSDKPTNKAIVRSTTTPVSASLKYPLFDIIKYDNNTTPIL